MRDTTPLVYSQLLERHRGDNPQEIAIAKEAMRVLHEHFPGYGWQAICDLSPHSGGLLRISLPSFMAATLAYTIYASDISSASDMDKEVREAGGHILERLRLRRAGLWLPEYREARSKAPAHGQGFKELPE